MRGAMQRQHKVWRAHRALFWLYALIAAIGALALVAAWFEHGSMPTEWLLPFGLTAGLALIHRLLGNGARRGRNSARIGSLLLGCIMLLGFPVGTLIGIYLIVNTVSRWVPDDVPE